MKKVILGKNKIAYLRTGGENLPKLVMLHATFANSKYFKETLFPALSKKYDILAPDFPGFGLSDPLRNKPHTLFSYTKVIKDLCDCLDFQPFHLLGSSLGGMVAINFTSKYPQYINRLILHATPWNSLSIDFKNFDKILLFLSESKNLTKLSEKLRGKFGDKLIFKGLELFKRRHYTEYNSLNNLTTYCFRTMDFQAVSELVKNIKTEDLTSKARAINKKTLIFVGENDGRVSPYKAGMLAKLIKGSSFRELKGESHRVILDRPKLIAGMVNNFLLSA